MSLFENFDKNSINELVNSSIFPARVNNISLDNTSDIFKKTGNWIGIGTIEFFPLFSTTDISNPTSLYAKPLFSNISQYPLKNEIVYILNGPTFESNDDQNSTSYYYINIPIGFWNSVNHNSYPDNQNNREVEFGNDFEEKPTLRKLLSYEGDILFEGRFGQSIRFGSTTKNKKLNTNFWSSSGNNGDPIIIISNNQKINSNQEPWVPTQEDLNEDGSTIIISSTQEIPLKLACNNFKSFNMTVSSPFNSSLSISST